MDNHDEETEEECKARLRKISEEVKSELKAGTFLKSKTDRSMVKGIVQYQGTITGRFLSKSDFDYDMEMYPPVNERADFRKAIHDLMMKSEVRDHLHDAFSYGSSMLSHRYDPVPQMVIFDECHYINPETYWLSDYEPGVKVEKDWKQTKFQSGGSTAPSKEKRAALRAKRKAKRK